MYVDEDEFGMPGHGPAGLTPDIVLDYIHDPHHHHDVRHLMNQTEAASLTDTEVIRTTCKIYGSIFAVLFVLFLLVRNWKPGVYNLKRSYGELNTPVAEEFWGPVSWMWKVFGISYATIAEECGMDAATTIRLFEFGVKLSIVGIINSIYLFPVYKYAGEQVTFAQDDPVKELSLSNMKKGNIGTLATAFSAYILFGFAMHMIDKDFEWFTTLRHEFLSKKRAQNFSLFLSGLPEDMQTDESLKQYFRSFTGNDVVIDGDVALDIPKLEKKVAKREALVKKLEHKINILTVKGETPMHTTKMCGGEKVESIPEMTKELDELNKEISEEIDRLETLKEERGHVATADPEAAAAAREGSTTFIISGGEEEAASDDPADDAAGDELTDEKEPHKLKRKSSLASQTSNISFGDVKDKMKDTVSKLLVVEDGRARNAAFVTLKNLTSTNLARQAVHSHEPWECVPAEPPNPIMVNWKNVGKGNQKRKIGQLISFFLTTLLCIFWTIPVTFVASLSNVEALTELLPFLKEPVEKYDWFANLLAQLAPLILVVFISLLPHILLVFVKLECLIEIETFQHPSLFSKLAAFTLIQTFFVSTIGGSIMQSIQTAINDPVSTVTLIAEALPAQSAYFIQLIIVQNLLAMGIELLRISPVVQNFIRGILIKILGYNLTEKERNASFLLRALSDPLEYYYGRELGAKTVLLMMVLYVYACMAPITCYFTLLVLGVLAIGFRNQFIYIYPIANDSGGKLWINFTRISILCMILAEIVLFIVLLLGENWPAAGLLAPLFVGTIIFDKYFKERHYLVTSYLPAGECAKADRQHESEGITYEWLNDQYLQPAMKQRTKYPSNYKVIAPADWVDPNCGDGEEEDAKEEEEGEEEKEKPTEQPNESQRLERKSSSRLRALRQELAEDQGEGTPVCCGAGTE